MKTHKLLITSVLLTLAVSIKSNPGRLFPEINGWDLETSETVYDPATLWEYINGAADIYLSYDFRNLYCAKYTRKNKTEVRVEIYEHSSPVNAFGIYTAERMPDYNFVNIGVQGYTDQGILNFLSGSYYVKLMSPGTIKADKALLISIAAEISDALGNTNTWPGVLDYFPPEGKIANTEGYIARDFLGYSFFHSAFIVSYESEDNCQMFIIRLNTDEEVQDMISSYTKILNEDKVMQEGNFYAVDDFFNGMIFMMVKSTCIIGVINLRERTPAEELLNKVKI